MTAVLINDLWESVDGTFMSTILQSAQAHITTWPNMAAESQTSQSLTPPLISPPIKLDSDMLPAQSRGHLHYCFHVIWKMSRRTFTFVQTRGYCRTSCYHQWDAIESSEKASGPRVEKNELPCSNFQSFKICGAKISFQLKVIVLQSCIFLCIHLF